MKRYFTDRELGSPARTVDVIDERIWGGLYSIISARCSDNSFGFGYPDACQDNLGPCGFSYRDFKLRLHAVVPGLSWPLYPFELPSTLDILDLLDFCAEAVGEPNNGDYHPHYKHYHLQWDRAAGLRRLVSEVNSVFTRNGIAFEFTDEGKVRRILSEPLASAVQRTKFSTEDDQTNRLLETACLRIASAKPDDRQDAIEKLWDAFERVKTLEPGLHKKAQAEALLDRVASPGSRFHTTLAAEARALTEIGNNFRIRHSERDKENVESTERVDYLFARMFAFLRLILQATNRGG